MSSWKKAAKTNQKTHRERDQLESRKHLGLLEKKKDYKLRAQDRNEKQETLKLLRKRALNKNPDEFYHHMINSKIAAGEHFEKEKKDQHSDAQIKLMQSQDFKYIAMKRTIEGKKIKRLQSQLHMTDVANHTQNKHTFFVDTPKEANQFEIVKHLKTHPSLINRKSNRILLKDIDKMSINLDDSTIAFMNTERDKSYRELSKRIEREKEMAVLERKIELKRYMKEKMRRIAPGNKDSAPMYKFNYVRKK